MVHVYRMFSHISLFGLRVMYMLGIVLIFVRLPDNKVIQEALEGDAGGRTQ